MGGGIRGFLDKDSSLIKIIEVGQKGFGPGINTERQSIRPARSTKKQNGSDIFHLYERDWSKRSSRGFFFRFRGMGEIGNERILCKPIPGSCY